MNKATVHVLLFLVLVTLEGCIKPFDADSLQYDRAIVVEGLITNEDKIHSVKLSYTYPINDRRGSKLSGAQVWVEDGSGEKIDYAEAEPGYYQSQINFAASIDKEYSLVFVTEEGDEYRSQESSLINPAPIDSIYAKYAELPIDGLA